jgi:2-iminobutanoate/2-iminopropanoate deaminase
MSDPQNTDEKPVTFGPYSPVRQAGDFFFVSGQVGVDPATKNASIDVADQTRQALENLKQVLESVDLSLDNVVKTTIFTTDMADFPTVNEVYIDYFNEPRPARSTVTVKELPRVAGSTTIKIEIEAIATKAVA